MIEFTLKNKTMRQSAPEHTIFFFFQPEKGSDRSIIYDYSIWLDEKKMTFPSVRVQCTHKYLVAFYLAIKGCCMLECSKNPSLGTYRLFFPDLLAQRKRRETKTCQLKNALSFVSQIFVFNNVSNRN